jgi:hypothetical protein
MSNISVLKIVSSSGRLLMSRHVSQEISPVMKGAIYRNINSETFKINTPLKLRCLIETTDIPNKTALKLNDLFTIYSIIKFKREGLAPMAEEYVPKSVENYEDHIVYRPVFRMILTNFCCKNNNLEGQTWKLEFEEE